jgi:putative DNA primase/helicase
MRANQSSIDFERIKAAALRSARSLLQELVPNGRFEGREYVALNPSRADESLGSFKINWHTGVWWRRAYWPSTARPHPLLFQ